MTVSPAWSSVSTGVTTAENGGVCSVPQVHGVQSLPLHPERDERLRGAARGGLREPGLADPRGLSALRPGAEAGKEIGTKSVFVSQRRGPKIRGTSLETLKLNRIRDGGTYPGTCENRIQVMGLVPRSLQL